MTIAGSSFLVMLRYHTTRPRKAQRRPLPNRRQTRRVHHQDLLCSVAVTGKFAVPPGVALMIDSSRDGARLWTPNDVYDSPDSAVVVRVDLHDRIHEVPVRLTWRRQSARGGLEIGVSFVGGSIERAALLSALAHA